MKKIVKLDVELSHCKLDLPKQVSLIQSFDENKVLGLADVKYEGEDVVAEIDVDREIEETLNSSECFEYMVSGIVKKREGEKIIEFSLTGVSVSAVSKRQ